MTNNKFSTLFCDIGGVLLTNGWGRQSRKKAASFFNIDFNELESRHQLCFYLYEIGKISLSEYLRQIVFYQPRQFTSEEFADFMYKESEPLENMIPFIKSLKNEKHVKVAFLSNEGKELAEHRIKKFSLNELADLFIVSSFVNLRKPDREIYRMAIELVQTSPEKIVYLDDRLPFIEIAAQMGMHAIQHIDFETTQKKFERLFE